jgi:hypothetical protein
MTNHRNTQHKSRPAFGRFTPRGILQPTPPARSGDCACPACEAEARGEKFSVEAERDRITGLVDEQGVAVQYVGGDAFTTAWAYTIGRLRRGLPELITIGLDPSSAHGILLRIDQQWSEHPPATDGSFDHDKTYRLLPVPNRIWATTDYLLGAARDAHSHPNDLGLVAFQVVWADPQGRFPWEPGVNARLRRLQPLLGLRSVA